MRGRLVVSTAVRLAVLASGSGTLLEAILAAGIDVALVVVDRPCRAIDVAESAGVRAELVEREHYGKRFDRDGFTERVVGCLSGHGIELVAMAGFGTILGVGLQDAYAGRVLNTHPSLLPSFPGWHAVADALDYGVKVTGCTVHIATLEVDAGPILAQRPVAVHDSDTVATLHERIKKVERDLYPATIAKVLADPALTAQP